MSGEPEERPSDHLGKDVGGPRIPVVVVERALDDDDRDPRAAYVFAEVVRGAFLGLAAHLESTWPAPVISHSTLMTGDST